MSTPRIKQPFSATGCLALTATHVFYGAKSTLGTRGGERCFFWASGGGLRRPLVLTATHVKNVPKRTFKVNRGRADTSSVGPYLETAFRIRGDPIYIASPHILAPSTQAAPPSPRLSLALSTHSRLSSRPQSKHPERYFFWASGGGIRRPLVLTENYVKTYPNACIR